MKKIFTLLLSALCVAGLSVAANAEPSFNQQYQIPKASTAPVIDGVMSEGEWANALMITMNADTTEQIVGGSDYAKCPEGKFYWMWDDAGIYFYGKVVDTTEPFTVHKLGNGHYNSGDGIQFCVYPNIYDTSGSENKTGLFFWDLVFVDDGSTACGEHFPYGNWDHLNNQWGKHMNEVISAGSKDGSNYVIEAFFPSALWTVTDTPLYVEEGTTFAMANVLMEENSIGEQSLFVDTAWFYAPDSNKYTLVNTPAGIQPETPVKAGDINCDDTVDINDAMVLFQHSMLPEMFPIDYPGSADFNGDGAVDINDAMRLFQHSMLPDIFPLF